MSDTELIPYLFFNGEASEAMEFYRDVFGGELTKQSYSEVPGMESDSLKKDWLMHVGLSGGDIKLFASDTEKAGKVAAKIELSINGSDEVRLREVFGKLSDGGNVTTPLRKEFWGDIFGQLHDKYGIDWMVNISVPKAA